MSFARQFLSETAAVAASIDSTVVEAFAEALAEVRNQGGRLFILGVGGSAANASHAACDFRKATCFEAYAPSDNVSELTASTNDEGWDQVFASYLRGSRLCERDALLVLSVGGGDVNRNVSTNLIAALDYGRRVRAKLFAIVGRDGGYATTVADHCIIIPTVAPEHVTAHAEAFQSVLWHLLVSHPALQKNKARWEVLTAGE